MEHKRMKDQHDDEDYDEDVAPSLEGPMIIWGIVSLVMAVLMVTYNNSGMVLSAGFFAKFFAVLAGGALGFIGAMIGDAICRFVRPTAIFTQGFFALLFAKLFWLVGPQLIGLLIGVSFGASLVLS